MYARHQRITNVVVILIKDKFIVPTIVYTLKDIAENMLKVHDASLTYLQAWRAKEKAIKLMHGDPTETYAIFELTFVFCFMNLIGRNVSKATIW